jgi:hypothetical protein
MCSMQPGGLRVGGCLVCQLPWKTLAALAAWQVGAMGCYGDVGH